MNTTKFFMSLGTLVLASAAILAAKPAKKTAVSIGNFKNQNAALTSSTIRGLATISSGTSYFTSNVSGAFTVRLITKAGVVLATLKTNATGTNKLYYHP